MVGNLRLAPLNSAIPIFESPGLAGAFLFWRLVFGNWAWAEVAWHVGRAPWDRRKRTGWLLRFCAKSRQSAGDPKVDYTSPGRPEPRGSVPYMPPIGFSIEGRRDTLASFTRPAR